MLVSVTTGTISRCVLPSTCASYCRPDASVPSFPCDFLIHPHHWPSQPKYLQEWPTVFGLSSSLCDEYPITFYNIFLWHIFESHVTVIHVNPGTSSSSSSRGSAAHYVLYFQSVMLSWAGTARTWTEIIRAAVTAYLLCYMALSDLHCIRKLLLFLCLLLPHFTFFILFWETANSKNLHLRWWRRVFLIQTPSKYQPFSHQLKPTEWGREAVFCLLS